MRPLQVAIRRHETSAEELPDIYAQVVDPSVVYDIMEAQVQSMRDYGAACGDLHNLPREETWDYFKTIGRIGSGQA